MPGKNTWHCVSDILERASVDGDARSTYPIASALAPFIVLLQIKNYVIILSSH